MNVHEVAPPPLWPIDSGRIVNSCKSFVNNCQFNLQIYKSSPPPLTVKLIFENLKYFYYEKQRKFPTK